MDTILWLAAMIVFLLVEASTEQMICLWFACGALASTLVSLFSPSPVLQIVVFLVVSLVLLASLRPLVRKYITPKLVKTNVDAVVGTKGIVTEQVDNLTAQGAVKLGAVTWTARSTSGEPIQPGTTVQVDRIEGVKVFVSPVTERVKS